MRKYTGKVVGSASGNPPTITIDLDGDRRPRVDTTVEVALVLTDEEIGRRLRNMLTMPTSRGFGKEGLARLVRELADSVQDEAGWPILADLIREVADES